MDLRSRRRRLCRITLRNAVVVRVHVLYSSSTHVRSAPSGTGPARVDLRLRSGLGYGPGYPASDGKFAPLPALSGVGTRPVSLVLDLLSKLDSPMAR